MKKRFPVRMLAVIILILIGISLAAFTQKLRVEAQTRSGQAVFSALQETPSPHRLNALTVNSPGSPGYILLDTASLRPKNRVWDLGGNQVLFGSFDNQPMTFRILANPDTQILPEGKASLLLDASTVLFCEAFDSNFARNEAQQHQPNEWSGGDIEITLNGSDFYSNPSVFSEAERAVILSTVLDQNTVPITIGNWTYEEYDGESRIFALSAGEANLLYAGNPARDKDGASNSWWLRSACGSHGNGAGSIHGDGHICNNTIQNSGVGVSPAMNIDLSAIAFAYAVHSNDGTLWKLALLDTGKNVTIPDGQKVTVSETDSGTMVTVPFACTGDGISRICVVITDGAIDSEGAQVLYRGIVKKTNPGTSGGIGAFLLPDVLTGLSCGTDYHCYIYAAETPTAAHSYCTGSFCEIIIS